MRPELTEIETIEKYLLDQLSDEKCKRFQKRLETDEALRLLVEQQRHLMEALERISLKESIQRARKKLKMSRNGRNFGLGSLIVIGITAVTFLLFKSSEDIPADRTFDTVAEQVLDKQQFKIDNSTDTVLETENGIIVVIPAKAFEDASDRLTLEVVEALSPLDIVRSGLSTTADGELLETAGMFKIKAYANGKSLKLKEDKRILVSVPTNEVDPDMKLFEGVVQSDKTINWVNPESIEHDLTPVDILSLDFYPPQYIPTVRSLGNPSDDKIFTDSLYYSFSTLFNNKKSQDRSVFPASDEEGESDVRQSDSSTLACGINLEKMHRTEFTGSPGYYNWYNDEPSYGNSYSITTETYGADTVVSDSAAPLCHHTGINPAQIKSIWDTTFNNTLLATYEFQERLMYMHSLPADHCKVLEAYVANLTQPLWYCDSIAFELTRDLTFRLFKERRDGVVQLNDDRARLLTNYFHEKTAETRDKVRKTEDDYYEKQRILAQKFMDKQNTFSQEDFKREHKILNEEYKENLNKVIYSGSLMSNVHRAFKGVNFPRARSYRVEADVDVFYNIDKYVWDATENRESLDYTDPITGDMVKIIYEPMELEIKDDLELDRMFVYLLPDKLSSFMRVIAGENGVYREKLNSSIEYDLMAIGFKGKTPYVYHKEQIKPKKYTLRKWEQTTWEALDLLLSQQKNELHAEALQKEIEWRYNVINESIRQENFEKKERLKQLIKKEVFGCDVCIPEFQIPVKKDYRYISGFGMRRHPVYKVYKLHTGVDFSAPSGTPVYASSPGTVIEAGNHRLQGNYVSVSHCGGYVTNYHHLKQVLVKSGEQVSTEQMIGFVGNTGMSTAPHLHFEIYRNGMVENPKKYLPVNLE